MKRIIATIASSSLAATTVAADAGDGSVYGMMGWPMYGGVDWLWMLLCLAFWVAVIWFIVWLVRKASGNNREKESPQDILRRRYAKGEITKKQFEKMKKEM